MSKKPGDEDSETTLVSSELKTKTLSLDPQGDPSSEPTEEENELINPKPETIQLLNPVVRGNKTLQTPDWLSARKGRHLANQLDLGQTSKPFRGFLKALVVFGVFALLLMAMRSQPKLVAKYLPPVSKSAAKFLLETADEGPTAPLAMEDKTLGVFRLDPLPENAEVLINHQVFKPNELGQIFAPTLTMLSVQVTAVGFRPSRFDLVLADRNDAVFKSGLVQAQTGLVDLVTLTTQEVEIFSGGEKLYEGKSPLSRLPLPEGQYTALLKNELLAEKKSVDFDVTVDKTTRVELKF